MRDKAIKDGTLADKLATLVRRLKRADDVARLLPPTMCWPIREGIWRLANKVRSWEMKQE